MSGASGAPPVGADVLQKAVIESAAKLAEAAEAHEAAERAAATAAVTERASAAVAELMSADEEETARRGAKESGSVPAMEPPPAAG